MGEPRARRDPRPMGYDRSYRRESEPEKAKDPVKNKNPGPFPYWKSNFAVLAAIAYGKHLWNRRKSVQATKTTSSSKRAPRYEDRSGTNKGRSADYGTRQFNSSGDRASHDQRQPKGVPPQRTHRYDERATPEFPNGNKGRSEGYDRRPPKPEPKYHTERAPRYDDRRGSHSNNPSGSAERTLRPSKPSNERASYDHQQPRRASTGYTPQVNNPYETENKYSRRSSYRRDDRQQSEFKTTNDPRTSRDTRGKTSAVEHELDDQPRFGHTRLRRNSTREAYSYDRSRN